MNITVYTTARTNLNRNCTQLCFVGVPGNGEVIHTSLEMENMNIMGFIVLNKTTSWDPNLRGIDWKIIFHTFLV